MRTTIVFFLFWLLGSTELLGATGPIAVLSDLEGSIRKLQRFMAAHEQFERGADGR